MNTISQIENALKGIDQASFQRLINHLLFLQGNYFVGAPGAAVGKEKTSKGTPDSFFINNDLYTFVECTTKEKLGESKSFFQKLVKDINHCFNEDLTTVRKEEIEKVVLACNEKVTPKEYNQLLSTVRSHNSAAIFEILNIQNLPLLIYELPKLAEEYLNIQIVKGDIFKLQEFLIKTTKGLQPSLTNEFFGREEEFKNSLEVLQRKEILLLSGGQGVGKSKLAVKILEELSKNGYIPIVIQSSGVSLWDDYKHLFSHGKQYIVLFDDANKSITNLNYLLNNLEATNSYSAKVIITSRDYVKKQVLAILENYPYEELNVPEFKDEEIGKIILSALPNLKYHSDIKRKIIDLAKGNTRVALMATYSVTPDSETNYLSSPVLLYEKYFKKISSEIFIFDNSIILKSLAIVSFFGVVDRNNNELEKILSTKFGIDWNELWTAIMELHNSEILDVYAGEIVKVSDQVLATYSFYSCFVNKESAVINYSDWIVTFLEKFSHRLQITLIDTNNTFIYHHIKDLVLPHLDSVLKNINSDEELYSFYNLFWFYKGIDCLVYIKKWIANLNQEQHPESIQFNFVHNDHTKASKYFELLKGFWNHPNELLKPSIQLTLQLLERQPSRLSEIIKFIHDDFKYKIADLEDEYLRQNILFDVLFHEDLSNTQRLFANGIFLSVAELLLGWRYTEFGSGKGREYRIYHFNLSKSEAILKLRKRILVEIYNQFDSNNKFSQKILHQIVYPGGDIDKSIYLEELPVYQSLISEKLDKKQYAHCKFVSVLAKHLTQVEIKYPESWEEFIQSDIRKLYEFIKPIRVGNKGKSCEDIENKNWGKCDNYIGSENWRGIEIFFERIDDLYGQLLDKDSWNIERAVADILIFVARKDRQEFENALRLYFGGKALIPLNVSIIGIVLHESIVTGEELLRIMEDYEFQGKPYWKSSLLAMLPQDQVNELFLRNLIEVFQIPDERVYLYRMIDYIKYETVFNAFKDENFELYNHNIITYLTSIILAKKSKTRNSLGFDFCAECGCYFKNNFDLLKEAYFAQYENDSHFDYEGKELRSILDIDRSFINDSLRNEKIGLGYSSSLRLEYFNTDLLWEYDEYEELIENLLITILEKEKYSYMAEGDINSIFIFRNADDIRTEKVKSLITKLTKKHLNDEKIALMLVEVVYQNFRDWFIEYFRDFLSINDNIEITKKISFDRSASTSGSWVPVYQKKIDFYQDILKMIKSLPNILEYSDHVDYFEEKISLKKKDIAREQKRDFMDEFY